MNKQALHESLTNPEYLRLRTAYEKEHEAVWSAYRKNPQVSGHTAELARLRVLRHELAQTPQCLGAK